MSDICRTCGATESQTIADARTLGLLKELQNRIYNCCQITAWADEQRRAWVKAAEEDGNSADDATRPLESGEAEAVIVPVRLRHRKDSRLRHPFEF
jgi:hypothetical protein